LGALIPGARLTAVDPALRRRRQLESFSEFAWHRWAIQIVLVAQILNYCTLRERAMCLFLGRSFSARYDSKSP